MSRVGLFRRDRQSLAASGAAARRLRTIRPFLVLIRTRNPCVRLLLRRRRDLVETRAVIVLPVPLAYFRHPRSGWQAS